jgi:hypothetical protein
VDRCLVFFVKYNTTAFWSLIEIRIDLVELSVQVIRLGQMMLTSKAVCSSTISFLAIAYKESLLPLLAKGMHKSLKSNLITRSFTLSFFVCGWTLG